MERKKKLGLSSQNLGSQLELRMEFPIPICSMYGIFANICPKKHPNVGKYTIHWAYGICIVHSRNSPEVFRKLVWSTGIRTKRWILLRYDMCPCYLKATDMWPWSVSSGVGIQGATGCHCGGVKSWSHQQPLSLGCDAFQAFGWAWNMIHSPPVWTPWTWTKNTKPGVSFGWYLILASLFRGKVYIICWTACCTLKVQHETRRMVSFEAGFLLAAKTCCGVGKKSVFQTLSSKWCWTPFSNMLTPNW